MLLLLFNQYMTKDKIYIIPGLGENCNLVRYKNLANSLSKKGYSVISVNPDWYQPLTKLVFEVEKNSIIVGFSFGAVLGYLIAKKYTYKKAIFASMSPIKDFSYDILFKDYLLHMNKEKAAELAKDVKSINIDLKMIDTPFITIIGEEEKKELSSNGIPDIIIPKTRHYMSKKYIETILGLL